jgi:hypothetical protein
MRGLMGTLSEEQCAATGIYKREEEVETKRGGNATVPTKKIITKFFIMTSDRELSDVDVEHFMCKLYLLLHRYRGTRAYSLPSPLRAFCHPIPNDKDILKNNPCFIGIMNGMVINFERTVSSTMISPMRDPFTTCNFC